jgi:hypothetical protein
MPPVRTARLRVCAAAALLASGACAGGVPPGQADAGPADVRPDREGDRPSDAYFKVGAGPFGIPARPERQTCRPPARESQPADRLTATGCVDSGDPRRPAGSLIPYDVISPLWSDGVAGSRRLVPGAPERSLIVLRMEAPDRDSGRMPQLATSVLDSIGIALLSDWIRSIGTCP